MEFFDFVDQVFAKLDQRFAMLPAENQVANLILLDAETGEKAAEVFKRLGGQIDRDEVTGHKLILTLFFAVVGLVLTVLIGSFVIGFWTSLALGLLLWGGYTVWRAFRLVNEQTKQEKLEQELRDNPQLIGEMATQMMEELRKKDRAK